jgi:hypothetical protein
MTTLLADDITVMRQWIGSEPVDATLQTYYDIYDNHDQVVLHVLRERLAELSIDLGSVTVPGVSVSHSTDLQALQDLIKKFQNEGGTGLEDSFSLGGFQTQSIQVNFPR